MDCLFLEKLTSLTHGANRLGASALMQGLADGYFVIPYTLGNYFGEIKTFDKVDTDHPEFKKAEQEARALTDRFLSINGSRSVDYFHKKLGQIMWEYVGMSRSEKGLQQAIKEIKSLRQEFWNDVRVTGEAEMMNSELEKAGRVADFLELGELMGP
jgi:succinate dehydrogenase / fumarate reductase flavoprotein subunit